MQLQKKHKTEQRHFIQPSVTESCGVAGVPLRTLMTDWLLKHSRRVTPHVVTDLYRADGS